MESLGLLLFVSLATLCDGARILIFQPTPAKGHVVAVEPLFEELAARGHQVTILTSYPHKPPLPNLREIDFSHRLPPMINNFSFNMIKETMPDPFQAPIFMVGIELSICEAVYSDDKMKMFLESNETYDLIITEIFTTDCFVPFAHKFKAPLVSFVTSLALPWVADRVGLPDNPSYIPNYYVDFSSEMTFYERIYNTIVLLYTKSVYYYYSLPRSQGLIGRYFGDSTPPINDLIKNTSLVLVNSHFTLSGSRPFPPNVVEVGGIHLKSSGESLPKDLQDVLDRSAKGAVVVSFGSMVLVSSIPKPIINMFLEAFSKIPQTVILKFEKDLPEAPPNVVIRNWLPQREVIEHKNVKAVMTHGGLASTIEAVHFGKPLIGIPFFADQYLNVKMVARKSAGVILDMDNLSSEKIELALKKVLGDPSYMENARRLSQQFRDRPVTALQSAVYWIEYVIRHKGALHLRPASVLMSWYQYLLIDVAGVLLLPILPILYLVYFLFFRAVKISPNDYQNYIPKKTQ